ncbi:hypothetical protein BH09PSE5_BH09PSE5_41870 [soil metagenome]
MSTATDNKPLDAAKLAGDQFDSGQLRKTLGAFVTGVTVVTTVDASGRMHGVTANSFSSVSLDPPLILWSQALSSTSFPAFRDAERFAVNILADDQVGISNHFAKSREDKFEGVDYTLGLGGVPIIAGSAAHLECTRVASYPGGDHIVFIGRVERIYKAPRKALAFGEGKYMVAFAHDLGGAVQGDARAASLARVEAVRMASAAMPEICEQIGQRTLGLAVWGSHGPTIVRWEPSKNPVSEYLQTGVVVSIAQSATGNAFAAFLPRDQTQAAINAELATEPAGALASFEARLKDVRRHGIARAVGDKASARHQVRVNAFSAPVFDASESMILALSTTCAAETLDSDWDGPVPQALSRAARDLSRRLGYSPTAART